MRNYKRLEFRSKQTEKAQLENFTYNYTKLFPKNRGASKSDVMMFKSAKRSIAVLRERKDNLSRKYFDDSLVTTRLVGGSQSLFKLSEKLEILDKNLQILASSGLGADEASAFEKRLKSNQEFITELCKDRLGYVERTLLKGDEKAKNDFLVREYFKGVEVLGIKPDERLVALKPKPKLMSERLLNSRVNTQAKSIESGKNKGFEHEF